MADLPTGTVTFLFTDVEGSTRLWEEHPGAMKGAIARHEALLRQAVGDHEGRVFKTVGDAVCAAFATAPAALAAALAGQRLLAAEAWGETGPLRVRMALHTGAAEVGAGDYTGACLNRVARLLAVGYGGQVLVSQATSDLARGALPAGAQLADLGAHRLRDLLQPEHILQLRHPDLPAAFPALKTLDALPHNLPIQLTSFVGRARAIAEVQRLLATARLVTLTGPGGCGKTRLALQVAADLLDAYPDGVWFADLAPLTDPALVPEAVAAALGLPAAAGPALLPTLVDHLRARTALLLLDNCEHLVEAGARLVEMLLRSCAAVRVLATSREPLGVPGEVVWRVPPLGVPDPGRPSSAAGPAESEAVRLFVERARQVAPTFALTEPDAGAVARICRRLNGIPLAVELAAARVRVLSPAEILAQLDDRFDLLTGGSRTAAPRQQTLRATLDWSYDLLTDAERALFRCLSVLAGGFSLDAADFVCAARPAARAPAGILDLVAQLVDKSLVLADRGRGDTRYRMLETMQDYGYERLAEAGEESATWNRYARWILGRDLRNPYARWVNVRDLPADDLPDYEQDVMRWRDAGSALEGARAIPHLSSPRRIGAVRRLIGTTARICAFPWRLLRQLFFPGREPKAVLGIPSDRERLFDVPARPSPLHDDTIRQDVRFLPTVLAVDVAGPAPLAERLGEEETAAIMRGCFARVIDAVHRHQGTIAQFRVDGFLALFEGSIPHQDAARRAVAAALQMQRALQAYGAEVRRRHGVECRFRIGLDTKQDLAVGLQQLAEPGMVYLSERIYNAVRDEVECEPLGALPVEGSTEPVVGYRAVREK